MRSLKLFYYIFFIIFSSVIIAQEVKFTSEEIYRSEQDFEPSISRTYFRGKNLIYDCLNKHYGCVSELNYDACTRDRKDALKNREVLLPCAPLKKMVNQIECFRTQYTLIHTQTYKGFCISQKKID